jgi:Putative zinc-finger
MVDTPACAEVRDLIPELAAGVASGDDRARALVHLVGCPACRRRLDATAELVDELLLLAPEREPSPGFESTVIAALQPPPVRRWGRLPALALQAAALVLVAALSAGVTWWQARGDREPADRYPNPAVAGDRYLSSAPFAAATGPAVGQLFAYQGSPSWIFISLTQAPDSGEYIIYLTTRDNRTIQGGTCTVTGGRSYYGSAINLPVNAIQRVDLVKPGGPTLTAHLR